MATYPEGDRFFKYGVRWSELQDKLELDQETVEMLQRRDDQLEHYLGQTQWRSYTPTGSNFTIGNGTLLGRYRLQGLSLDYFIYFRLGSTSAIGTNPKFFVPEGMLVNTHVFDTGGGRYFAGTGTAALYDSSANVYYEAVTLAADSGRQVITTRIVHGGANVTATTPFTWTTADDIILSGTLELEKTTLD